MIKAVIFDIDGVLIDSFPANLKFFQDLMVKNGYTPPTTEQYKPIFHYDLMKAIRELSKTTDDEELKKMWEMGRSREVPYDTSLAATPANMPETIIGLSEEYKLGIVTSRIREIIFADTTLAKLKKYFRAVVAYQDTENHKPHPEPLLLAINQLGVEPYEAVYIGDVENDIKCARAAGTKVIGYAQEKFDNADATFSDYKNLPDIIKSL